MKQGREPFSRLREIKEETGRHAPASDILFYESAFKQLEAPGTMGEIECENIHRADRRREKTYPLASLLQYFVFAQFLENGYPLIVPDRTRSREKG